MSEYRVFPPRRDYVSLSVKDLLDARDAYHIYLSTIENVTATAIGRYLIHKDDWYAKNPPYKPRRDYPKVTEPRTLLNSVVRPWSWPAVLIFVEKWEKAEDLQRGNSIPRALHLPDGRVVPTCVVQAMRDESPAPPAPGPNFSSGLVGGGYSCLRNNQGQQSFGTIAALVHKGGSYYALTNRHVAGGSSDEVRAYIRGRYQVIGKTSNEARDYAPISEIFPQWSSARTFLTMDAGLVRIDDISDWTSQAYGIGEIGDVFDATEQTVTLDLIGCPVRGFGGSSGVSEGEIRALFFRYQSLGGYEYITDVLIGPRTESPAGATSTKPFTQPGDSGTLWFYDPPNASKEDHDPDFDTRVAPPERGKRARRLRPVAMQWGGERIKQPDGSASAYALGVFLSSICRSLDVQIDRQWSTGHDEYWGKIGHFAIGWKACDQLSGKLQQLMVMNQARIGFGDETLNQGAAFRMGRGGFVPLSDVPDYVWVGMKGLRPNEPSQHFADVDIFDIQGGPTLLESCIADPEKISASVWQSYFSGFAQMGVGPDEGCLPFRVWQIWAAMVKYLQKEDLLHFVAAAGVLAHYAGDASQPLHCSWLHHGLLPTLKVSGRDYPCRHESEEYAEYKKTRPAKIHAIYEEGMLEVDAASALADVNALLAQDGGQQFNVTNGHGAAKATVQLMHNSQSRLAPREIVESDDPDLTAKGRAKNLWEKETIRKATIASLADSVRLLAALWTSAWEIGGGDNLTLPHAAFGETELEDVYRRERDFLPSLSLEDMVKSGEFVAPKKIGAPAR